MKTKRKLMCIFAHPDDESMGMGSTLAKAAAEGVEISLICATRGEKGWFSKTENYPGAQELGRIREAELRQAAKILGIQRIDFLDYIDGELDQVPPTEAVPRIAALIREVGPQVVVSFGPDGYYGHPDHIAISQLTAAALVAAADPAANAGSLPPHRVDKYYYMVCSPRIGQALHDIFGEISIQVNGILRKDVVWPDWAITTIVQAVNYVQPCMEAIFCHRSQLASLPGIEQLNQEQSEQITGCIAFYRAYSLVNTSREREDDLFAGIELD